MDHSDLFVVLVALLPSLEHLNTGFPLIKMCSIFIVAFIYLEYDFHFDVLIS